MGKVERKIIHGRLVVSNGAVYGPSVVEDLFVAQHDESQRITRSMIRKLIRDMDKRPNPYSGPATTIGVLAP